MEVRVRRKCEKCGGSGVIQHPFWKSYFEKHGNSPVTEESIRKWFREEGFDSPPPEEIPCDSCAGTGFIEEWIGVKAFKEMLGL